ncbi:hypothetical protein GE107_22155 [Cohnella sp. CFH 77786]|uniref:DinB family protein n=1 Tax=Cohnella sp. CFH 77786 TaxID=2662265 RepID=UPI001C6093FD|nr:DinB family protein [Cohnella sp. CFH 77786]MBW5448748.1 hypothetical protein [Cohnella sp. CFH 77786]
MFRKIGDFAAEWNRESAITLRVLEALTDESLKREIVPGRRTLGRLAWHLVESLHYMTALGLTFEAPAEGREVPASAAAIADRYRRISAALLDAVIAQWSDESLAETQTVMGEPYENGRSLSFTLAHQAHHRGQMTVLMRQAGVRLPDLYGPTYESWIEKGMEPLA